MTTKSKKLIKIVEEKKKRMATKAVFVDGHFVASSAAESKEKALENFKKAFPDNTGKNIKVENWLTDALLNRLQENRK
jgi:hypothetical protein